MHHPFKGWCNFHSYKKMRLKCTCLLLMVVGFPLFAQKLDTNKKTTDSFKRAIVVKAYRSYMKEKNYAKAKQTIDEVVGKYDVAAQDAQLYRYKLDALNELIGLENKKIYLNSRPDTVVFFNYIYELYMTGLTCDSVEQRILREKEAIGKKVMPKLRYGLGQTLLPYRKNLLGAGKFFYKKKDYKKAFRFLDMYARTKTAGVFLDNKGETIVADPEDFQEVAVLAVLSAYGSENHAGVMAYLPESLADNDLEPKLLEVGSKSAAILGDTTEMLRLLETGFENYPESEYFFMVLTKYYNEKGDYIHALNKALKMTERYPNKRDYWYMAGKEQVLLGLKKEALVSFSKCVEIKADDAESFSAIGNIYLQDAHEAYARFNIPLSDSSYVNQKAALNTLYKEACVAFELARKFDEKNYALWLDGLREIYFKLNKGKELHALEKYQ